MRTLPDADCFFDAMIDAIDMSHITRRTSDANSAGQGPMLEAFPCGQTFSLNPIQLNFVSRRPIDPRWAVANTLHFFADTEEASTLPKYNKHASKFVSKGGVWKGAYGAIAMPQIRKCVDLLRSSRDTRRAIVSMGGFCDEPDINRPACWSFLHFLHASGNLDMIVYQRSLNAWGVMPYDLIVLTNILNYVAWESFLSVGRLVWTVGSLHMPSDVSVQQSFASTGTMLIDPTVLKDKHQCRSILMRGTVERYIP